MLKAYAIMPVGKNDESAHKAQKSHEVATRGFFLTEQKIRLLEQKEDEQEQLPPEEEKKHWWQL